MPTVRSRRVVLPEGTRPATIRHEDGVIVFIGEGAADEDFGDLVIMPGLVDTHVHVNDPGRTEWEGFASATRAAAAGGTTTVVDMPLNSIPPTVDVAALAQKRAAASGKLSVDVAFWGGLIPGSERHLPALVEEGVCGFKAFLVESGVPEFPPMSSEQLASVLPTMASLDVPLLLHAEDPARLHPFDGNTRSYAAYLESRPPECEGEAISVAAALSGAAEAAIHVLHISSSEGVEKLASGPPTLSGETCPHYLTFCSEEIDDGATVFKCAPPIRDRLSREALWEGLISGTLSMVVSDHSPAPASAKALESGDFATAWGGISSLQLRLPIIWTGAAERGVPLERLVEWLTVAPARLAGLDDRKAAIRTGADADLVIWDPDGLTEVRGSSLEHRHPITPYEGAKLRGRVHTTVLRGQTVFAGRRMVTGKGRMLRRP